MGLVPSPLKSQELFADAPRQVGACVNQSQKLLDDVSALSEARFQEKSVHERGAPARFR